MAVPFILSAGNIPEKDGTKAVQRPKVGLVLAGGGAKGAAHIGAIKYIEELGIPVDYVTGTSMGAWKHISRKTTDLSVLPLVMVILVPV